MAERAATTLGALLLAAGLVLVPAPLGRAQPAPATLIADAVRYDEATGVLTARGDVEVLYQGRVLRARAIAYDERAGEIRAEGPLVVTDPGGGVLIADAAALTPDLAEGLIEGARLLIDGRLQLAAAEVRRAGNRYTSLYRTVASTCTICAENPTPTWAIRAARVTQDAEARRIYFEDARVEAFGVPIALLPRLSIPEPGVERASGFLAPDFVQSDNIYGFGAKLPYYRVLGAAADVTVTPFLTTTGAAILEGEYRRRFEGGGFDLTGIIALEDGLGGEPGRGFVGAVGAFELNRGFVASFDLSAASDSTFLQQFDYSDADLLTSTLGIGRTRDDDYLDLSAYAFQSLREDEDTSGVPYVLPTFTYRRLYADPVLGGRIGLDLDALGLVRDEGTDVVRAGGGLDWQRGLTLPRGVLASATAGAGLELYRVANDPDAPDTVLARADPTLAVELRWPLARDGRAQHVLEPIAQVVWSDTLGRDVGDIPNEDSQLPEFDETNLFALDRFPGLDRVETGLRANLGVSYTRYDPAGWSVGATVGRVVRAEPDDDFWQGTGLAGRWSDYVAAVSLDFGWGLGVVNRALFDPDLGFNRNELGVIYDGERGDLAAAYVYLAADDSNPYFPPQPETSELALDARLRVLPSWELRGLWRYDLVAGANLRAGAGITYGNECAEVDLSLSRRYTSSANVPASTSIGFSVRLAGLGATGEQDWPERVCLGG